MDEIERIAGELAHAGALVLKIKAVPKSSRTELAGRMSDGTLKIKVAAVPEKGKANRELCAFLAKQLGLPKSNVTIESGHTSPNKRIRVRR